MELTWLLIIPSLIFYVLLLFFYKSLINWLKNPLIVIKKIISLGVEGMWEFVKPYIKWLIIGLIMFSFIPASFWEKSEQIKSLFNYNPKGGGVAILVKIIITWPLKFFLKVVELVLFPLRPITNTATWLGSGWLFFLRGLVFSLWGAAIYKAAVAQHQREKNKKIEENEEDIEEIKRQLAEEGSKNELL